MINILPIPAFQDNYIWAIVNNHNNSFIVVDPGTDEPVTKFAHEHNLSLHSILITHHHYDHVGGLKKLARNGVTVYGPKYENIAHVTNHLIDNDTIHIDDYGLFFEILHIPGHTLGHIAYKADGILFCGDTLFSGGCGRLFEGTYEQMYDSLSKLKRLPNSTKVYCAHEYTLQNLEFALTVEPNNKDLSLHYKEVELLRKSNKPSLPSTIDLEKKINPFLRNSEELYTNTSKAIGKNINSDLALFTSLRQLKDSF